MTDRKHAGSDSQGRAAVLDNVRVVLVGPLYGGNIGSVCRAMDNMGFCDLVLVSPRKTVDWDEARMMACHATDILDSRSTVVSMAEAVSDCAFVFGTTCRSGLYRQHVKSPREWAGKAMEGAHAGRIALVFGREDNGLSNEELALCTHLIRIPTATRNLSLNVAQAAAICLYELFVGSGEYEPPREKSPEAASELRERMFTMWRKALLDIGFMEEDKADHMMLALRRILARGPLTEDDVRILMGMAKQATWAGEKAKWMLRQDPDGTTIGGRKVCAPGMRRLAQKMHLPERQGAPGMAIRQETDEHSL
jgi:tRNA/rRNA methyltransferase